jgi:hypothetical protein
MVWCLWVRSLSDLLQYLFFSDLFKQKFNFLTADKKNELDGLYTDWVISASLPHSVNRNKDAKKFVNALCPGYSLPEPRKVTILKFKQVSLFVNFFSSTKLSTSKNKTCLLIWRLSLLLNVLQVRIISFLHSTQ